VTAFGDRKGPGALTAIHVPVEAWSVVVSCYF
jgi:hypothetical protein